MLRASHMVHLLLRQVVKPGDFAVDATVGNAHDTVVLAELVGQAGQVFGFEVQEAALTRAMELVRAMPHVHLFHAGHEHMAAKLPDAVKGRLTAVVFNLGYLPGGRKDIITRAETTLKALHEALGLLAAGGLITVVLYPGHEGGDEEAAAVRAAVSAVPPRFAVTQWVRLNAATPAPELIAIHRLS